MLSDEARLIKKWEKCKTDKPELSSDTSSSKDDGDAECIYCSELWSAGNDGI